MTDAIEPFDTKNLNWTEGLLAGWSYVRPVKKWFQGSYHSVHRIERPCPTCQQVFGIEVTSKALSGDAKNHGIALRRCAECRKALKRVHHAPEEYKARKAIGADLIANDLAPVVIVEGAEENAALRMANQTMKEEIDGLYVQLRELREQLAQYDLPAALRAADGATHAHEPTPPDTASRLYSDGPTVKLPWQS